MKKELSVIRIASLVCGITLAIIAYFVFSTSSTEFVDTLTKIGEFFGGGTTYGFLVLAALPPLLGFLCAFLWAWWKK